MTDFACAFMPLFVDVHYIFYRKCKRNPSEMLENLHINERGVRGEGGLSRRAGQLRSHWQVKEWPPGIPAAVLSQLQLSGIATDRF